MGLEPGGFSKFIYKFHSWFVPLFAIAWIIAMIKIWDHNVEGTGLWFAFAMVFLGFVVLIASLLLTFIPDKTNDFFRGIIDGIGGLFKKKR